ncbi:glyoxalase [Mangrovimonas yunxiaonensis]|uniref:Glyoxalase n=1 Tax=Mangrovimonas yunxiaonensis TaxID=1197477 RepID=A0A084TJA5_9FLAO|nr:VOC family protein [Mangrovimonas yunxiaonensis]KFB00791.1 glyoxalase [Mangrovimonas yunxiaonensis]GGH45699.1 glyoxalase [Mangrovimonas yunxiaonensis]
MTHNMVGWFEIPVLDMERAKTFYETVFKISIQVVDFDGLLMGWFPDRGQAHGANGTLIKQATYVPSEKGTLVYFISEDVNNELNRVVAAGGKLYQPKTQISPEHGFMGAFIDTEGNRVALHSVK